VSSARRGPATPQAPSRRHAQQPPNEQADADREREPGHKREGEEGDPLRHDDFTASYRPRTALAEERSFRPRPLLGPAPPPPPGRVNVVYQPRQDWRDRKTPCPLLVVQVRPVIRDVQVNAAKRHVDPYASRRYAGTFRFEL
jgi:hypothetical protein